MRLNRRPGRRRLISLTPLIDVVFLLLVFFMLATTFLKYGSVQLEAAGSGPVAGGELAKLAIIHVEAGGDFLVDGAPVPQAELALALGRLVRAGKREAVVVVRRGATVADLVSGLAVVRREGFASVRVVE